jgi:ribosome-associated protein
MTLSLIIGRQRDGPDQRTTTLIRSPATEARSKTPQTPADAPSDTLALATHALDEMKAEDTIVIELAGKTSLADQMIITSGRSNRHVASIADEVVKTLKDAGHASPRVEGLPHADWVLIDAGDVVVHVFRPEVRQFYNLEKMWGVDRPTEQPHL